MRKMILLAAMAAMAALMLAATPAVADDLDFDGFDDAQFFCDNDDDDSNGFIECDDLFIVIPVGDFDDFCDDFDFNGFCSFDEEDDFCDFFDCKDDFDEFCQDFDGDFFCDDFDDGIGDFEQEAESGDVDQSFYVSNTGDNSNQTVGIQGVANTGNAQNQIGVTDAGGFGDFDGNDDERFFFVDDFCDLGDSNGDGICDRLDRLEERFEERCEDGNGDGFCDRLEERIDRLEDRTDGGFFFVVDDFDGDGFSDSGSDFEFEDVGASIEVSPTNTVTSDQQVNQAAAAFGGK